MQNKMKIRKGINLGGWMSQCDYTKEHLDTFITETDFAEIASLGFDHVRIPVDYNLFQNEDGSLIAEGFARLDNALALAEKYHLKVVLDLHKTAGFSFDAGEHESGFFENEKYQEMFYQLWDAFAERYGRMTGQVVFELLNEVTDQCFIETWNKIAEKCIERIRRIAPDILILVGSYENNSVKTVPALEPPHDDRVLYNFHCYDPLLYTHQGATWTDAIDPDARLSFAESGVDDDYFEKLFAGALHKAEHEHTSLYCGEYGVIQFVSPEETLAWFRRIHEMFEKYDIPRAAWCWKGMHFGLKDARLDGIRRELVQCM